MKVSIVQRVSISFFVAAMLFVSSGVFSFGTALAASTLSTKATSAASPMNDAPTQPSVSCPQPDRHQDISTLTLQERLDQGYPMPINGKTDPRVDQIIHDKGKHFCADTDVPRTLHSSIGHREYNSRTWSGNFADGGNNYTYVQAFWTESCIAWGTNDHYSTWAGIGGIGNNNLVQAGADGDNWNAVSHDYVAWVENLGSGYNVSVFNFNCGDNMLAEVASGNCMLIVDQTSGATSGWRCSGANANSSTAECIVEAPTVNGSTAYLSNYGTQQFRGCAVEVNAGSTQGINSVAHDYNDMYNGNTLLSSTGPITNNDTYTMTWHHYS